MANLPNEINDIRIIQDLGMNSTKKKRYCIAECPICRKHFQTNFYNLKSKQTTKCRPCADKLKSIKHGYSRHELYSIYIKQISRCTNKKDKRYKYYGARGIKIKFDTDNPQEWIEYVSSLPNFKNRNKLNLKLDRINNDGHYEKGNLRWATRETQTQNRRRIQVNNTSGYRGVSKCQGKYVARIGVDSNIIYLGRFKTAKRAALAYDTFVIVYGLEHTRNFA